MPILTQLRSLGYIIAGFALAAMFIALQVEKRHSRKLAERNIELSTIVDNYAAKSRERQKDTARIITRYRDAQPIIEERVRVVEKAPLPGNCATPPEILAADL